MAFFRNPTESGNAVTEDVGEVAKETKDELAKFLEAAKSSVKPQQQSPQAQQQAAQKAQQAAQQRAFAQKFISDAIRDEQYKDRWLMKKKQEEQKKEAEEAQKKQIQEIQIKKKAEQMTQAVMNAKRKGETRNKTSAA